MKYHYFHGRFTYSVKRSGLLYFVWVLPIRSRVGLILVLKRVRSRWSRVAVGGGGRRRSHGRRRSSPLTRLDLLESLFRDAIRAEDSAGWGV